MKVASLSPWIVCLLVAACNGSRAASITPSTDDDNCSVPSEDIYMCEAGVEGQGACRGFDEDGSSIDASYPVGCRVRLAEPESVVATPACPHPARECGCSTFGDAGPTWLCNGY